MKVSEGEGYFWRYCIMGWLCPAVLVTVSIILDYVKINEIFIFYFACLMYFFSGKWYVYGTMSPLEDFFIHLK